MTRWVSRRHRNAALASLLLANNGAADQNVTATNDQVSWSSGWHPTDSNCSSSKTPHASSSTSSPLSFAFNGTSVYVMVLRNSTSGVYTLSVDNEPSTSIDTWSSSSHGTCDLQLAAEGLSPGPHTLSISYNGSSPHQSAAGPSFVEIDGFLTTVPPIPSSSNSSVPYSSLSPPKHSNLSLTAGGLVGAAGLLLSAAVLVVVWWRKRPLYVEGIGYSRAPRHPPSGSQVADTDGELEHGTSMTNASQDSPSATQSAIPAPPPPTLALLNPFPGPRKTDFDPDTVGGPGRSPYQSHTSSVLSNQPTRGTYLTPVSPYSPLGSMYPGGINIGGVGGMGGVGGIGVGSSGKSTNGDGESRQRLVRSMGSATSTSTSAASALSATTSGTIASTSASGAGNTPTLIPPPSSYPNSSAAPSGSLSGYTPGYGLGSAAPLSSSDFEEPEIARVPRRKEREDAEWSGSASDFSALMMARTRSSTRSANSAASGKSKRGGLMKDFTGIGGG
ncbi:hypothetical protein SISSUDRAFT_1042128 [Sistotremastrum suecicum HHB10207 ss-3]|uniref:Uncharacterized protein n=1 Tax=Sistotremastrum suecicum HHB10207 ss-3 TaxID=1314776 RepID=A0A166GQD3_9AGAM|nr:hypothetical protein SISSUDRAFT_1042128 [Sistotremastrum suecicum HHB10207 ss-3]